MFDHRLGKAALAFGLEVRFAQVFREHAQLLLVDRAFGHGRLEQVENRPDPKVTAIVDNDEALDQLARKTFERIARKHPRIGIRLDQQGRGFHDQADRPFAIDRTAIRPGKPHEERIALDQPDRAGVVIDNRDQRTIGIAFEPVIDRFTRIAGARWFKFYGQSPEGIHGSPGLRANLTLSPCG